MGRRRLRDRSLVVVGVVLIVAATVLAVRLYFLPPGQRDAVLTYVQFVLALVGVVITVLGLLRDVRRPADPRPVDTLVDLLAQAVRGQWRKAATERALVTPAPIPLRWSLTHLPVAGPVEAAVGDPDVAPAFSPLPGQARITEAQLQVGGGRSELFAVYAGIASGRLVLVGAPGSGKSATAILLLLDALEHRENVNAKERPRVPVPVLFTVHGWDPDICSVQDWLAAQLAATYPMFQYRGGSEDAAALVAAGAVALLLDGLDEMDVARRPVALQALSDAPFRVVVLTRSQEMVQAASARWLAGAVGLHLRDVTGPQGADYLQQARSEPPPLGWAQLLSQLREHPGSVLAHGLSTPLALTLLRDTYRPSDDVSDLLNIISQQKGVNLEQRLIARVLPDAYTPRPGRPAPRYSLSQAKQVLTFLAQQMNQDYTRDLAWWQIPLWVSPIPRVLVSMLAGGLLGGLIGVLLGWLGDALVAELGFGAKLGIGSGYVDIILEELMFGLGFGLPIGFGAGRGGHEPQRVTSWRAVSLHTLSVGRFYGILLVLALVLSFVLALTSFEQVVDVGPNVTLIPATVVQVIMGVLLFIFGFTVGLPLAPKRYLTNGTRERDSKPETVTKSWRAEPTHRLLLGFPVGLTLDRPGRLSENERSPQGPLQRWRNDQMCALVVGLVIGFGLALGVWLVVGLVAWLDGLGLGVALVVGLMFGFMFGLPAGLVYGIMSSVTWSTTLAWLQLQFYRQVPAIGIMSFLEDARDRGILRTVGAIYQFRHATLQDHLARQTTASRATSSVA